MPRPKGQIPKPAAINDPEMFAREVIASPALLDAIIRLLSWTDPDRLRQIITDAQKHLDHREAVLTACKEGNFGAKYVATGLGEPVAGRDILEDIKRNSK